MMTWQCKSVCAKMTIIFMQTTKKCPARDISRLESEDHINKAKDSTHEDAHLDKTKRKLVQNSSVKKNQNQTTTKQNKNKTHTKTTL